MTTCLIRVKGADCWPGFHACDAARSDLFFLYLALDDAVWDSSGAHQNQMMQLLSDPAKAASFARVVFDLLAKQE